MCAVVDSSETLKRRARESDAERIFAGAGGVQKAVERGRSRAGAWVVREECVEVATSEREMAGSEFRFDTTKQMLRASRKSASKLMRRGTQG